MGYGQNALSSSSPALGNRGRGRRSSPAPNPVARGSGVVRGRGERERVRRRFDSPTWLGLRWSEAAGHRERVAAVLGYSGGGVWELGERRHGVVKLGVGTVELGGAPRPFL